MKKRILCLVLALSLMISVISISSIYVSADTENFNSSDSAEGFLDRIKKDFDLVWSDEFNEDSLDTTKWQYDGDNCFRNGEAQMYSNGPEDGNVYMKDGCVVLKADKRTAVNADGKTKNYTSGEISTQGKQNFRYGYFEFSAKIPQGDNTFPAIWLMGYDYKKGSCDWPHSGEIDVMESLGGTYTWSTLHYSKYGQSGSGSHSNTGAGRFEPSDKTTLKNSFHKYWMYWTDKIIVIGVDNSVANIIDITTPELAQSFRNYDHFILFDLAMGPFGNKIKEADTDDWRFSIDYARIYQPKNNADYDNYKIIEAENTITDCSSGVNYSDVRAETIQNWKMSYINSTITDMKAGTYDIYAAYKSKAAANVGNYNTSINGKKIGTFNNSKKIETDAVLGEQKKIGTVKIEKDNLPFELRFDYESGKASDLQIDKYMFVKTDAVADFVVTTENQKELLGEVLVNSESEFDNAFSRIKDGGTIKFGADITFTTTKFFRKECIIDLNGHTLNTGNLASVINLVKKVQVNIRNGKINSSGKDSSLNSLFCANEVYQIKMDIENIEFNISAKTMPNGNALFHAYYGSCNYTVRNCTFNFTSTNGDENKPLVISSTGIFIDCTVNGNNFTNPFRIKNGNSNSVSNTEIYNTTVNNCNYVLYSDAAVTQYSKTTIGNSIFNNCNAFTNYAENLSFILLAENNKIFDLDNTEITLDKNLTNCKIVCEHSFSDPTCTEPSTCKYCMKKEGLSLGGHKPGEMVVTDSNCINSGSKVIKCTVCGEILSNQAIPIKEHNFEFQYEVVPSCKQEGYKIYKCTDCGLEQQRSYTNDATPAKVSHTPDLSKRITLNGTCTSGGKTTDFCTICKQTYESRRYRGQHNYVESKVQGDCLHESYTLHKCTLCEDEYKTDIVASSGSHTPDDSTKVVVPPSCGTEGYTEYTCSVCQETYKTDITPASSSHIADLTKDNIVAPTCTKKGYTEHTCRTCGMTYTDAEVPALGHKEVIDEAVSATCTKTGLTLGKHCSVCGEVIVKQDIITALGHKEVIDEAVSATCTKTGLTLGKHCSVCGEVIVAQKIIAMTKHKIILINVSKATYKKTGYTGDQYCSICKKIIKKGKSINKLKLKSPIISLKTKNKSITVSYNKITGAERYEIQIIINGKWKKYYTNNRTYTIKKLTKGKKYQIRVRAYIKNKPNNIYSSYSKTKYIKVK